MSKKAKKPALPASPVKPGAPGAPGAAAAQGNPRLQGTLRWQRTRRYGWDSR